MKISSQDVAQKLIDYLQHRISIKKLVDWAETVMMEGDFEEENNDNLRKIVSRLGVADVRSFGITWDDCEEFLNYLGYRVKVKFLKTTA